MKFKQLKIQQQAKKQPQTQQKQSTTVKTRIMAHGQQVVRLDRENNSKPSPATIESLKKTISENINSVDSSLIETQIRDTINSYEPRVDLIDVKVIPNYDEGSYDIVITYNIIGIDALAQQLTFALEQTR